MRTVRATPNDGGSDAVPDIDPVAKALEHTGLHLAAACGPGDGRSTRGQEELAKLIYEVGRRLDDDTQAHPPSSPPPSDATGPV